MRYVYQINQHGKCYSSMEKAYKHIADLVGGEPLAQKQRFDSRNGVTITTYQNFNEIFKRPLH